MSPRRQRESEALLQRRNRELTRALASTDGAFFSFNRAGAITSWSANAETLYGWSGAEALGRQMTETVIPVLYRKAYESGLANFEDGVDSPIVEKRVETVGLHHDGHEFALTMRIWALEEGAGFSAFARAVPDGPVVESPSVLTDPLTSLANRNSLVKDLTLYEAQVARYGHRSCIALIDIDDLKGYNERYGREAGDGVIVAVAARLAAGTRSGDSVYRYGGDEFICLLPEQSLETGAVAVDRMSHSIEELAIPFEGSPTGFVTVSAGLALLDAEHLRATEDLLKDADAALERTRHQGHDRGDGNDHDAPTSSL